MPDKATRTIGDKCSSGRETSCTRFQDLLLEYACEALPPQMTRDLLLHLSTCPACRKTLAEHLHLRRLIQQAMGDLADLPPDSWARFQSYARKKVKAETAGNDINLAEISHETGAKARRATHLRVVPILATKALEAALIPPRLSDLCGGALTLWVNRKLRSVRSGGVEPKGYPAAG